MAQASLLYADVTDLAGLNGVVLKQVEEFFVSYQKIRNIKVTILGRHGPTGRKKSCDEAVERSAEGIQRASTGTPAATARDGRACHNALNSSFLPRPNPVNRWPRAILLSFANPRGLSRRRRD